MQDWLAAQAHARPDGIALIAGDQTAQTWTYTALNQAAGHMAASLESIGVRRGDRVAALLPNCPDYVFLIHALARIGAVLVPLNTRLTNAELASPLQITKARWLATNAETRGTAALLATEMPGLALIDVDHLFSGRSAPILDGDIDLGDLQAVVFTSGTTGQPKGASITFGNQFWGAMGSAYRLGTLPDDRWLCCLPLFHVGGLAIIQRCCLYGTTVVLTPGFDLDTTPEVMAEHRITLISLVPTMVYRMLNQPEATGALQRARLVLIGGAATSTALLERCAALDIQAAPSYGLSEACSQVATMLPADARRKPGCTGKALLFSRVEIVDEQGQPVPPGTYGEVVVSGPTVMPGYYDNPDATAHVLRDGKLHTGDIGYLDEDGDLWLVQRRRDLIISGGENVYPAEVEQVLLRHPAVEAACVVGLPSAEWGQQVAAAVVLKPGTSLTESDLSAFIRPSLAGYKQPRRIQFVDALPMTGSGKVERRAVIDLLKSDADLPR